jgi:2-methylcitrate dehydratase PrpD
MAAHAGMTASSGALERYAGLALGLEQLHIAPAGEDFILDSYIKPFAAVRHVHYGAQAALDLRSQIGATRSIGRITLAVYDEAITYCGNRDPGSAIQAQFSVSFGVAAALRFGGLGPEAYREPQFTDAELRRLEKLVAIERDAVLSAAGRRGATLVVEAEGRCFERHVDAVKGDPALPMSVAEVREKFLHNAGGIDGRRAHAFADATLQGAADAPLPILWAMLTEQ